MLGDIASQLFIIVVLLVANGVFAAAELAMVSARRSRLEQQAAAGDRRARQALTLADDPDRLLATVQVGITLIGTIAAAFGGASLSLPLANWLQKLGLAPDYAETSAFILVVLLITYLSLIIGELVPKRLALLHADGMARNLAPLIRWMAWLTRPLVWVLTKSSTVVLKLIGQNQSPTSTVTEDDILYMAREGRAGGTVAMHEELLIGKVFDFSDRTARMIMTPRPDVIAVPIDTELHHVIAVAHEHGYSRLPLYEGDSLDRAVGSVHIKDLLPAAIGAEPRSLRDIMRKPIYVLEHDRASQLITRFRRDNTHLAFVVDEYGQIAGIITLDDIMAELVGDINDEYDTSEDTAMVKRDDGSWLVDGTESFANVAQRLEIEIPATTAFVTIAGYVLNQLRRIPTVSDSVPWGDYVVEVIDMDGRRIDKVLIRKG